MVLVKLRIRDKYPRKKWEEIEHKAELQAKLQYYNKFSGDIVLKDVELNKPITEEEIRVLRKQRKDRAYYRKNASKKKAQANKRYWRKQIGRAEALNEPFKACEGHHISVYYLVYIPRKLHQKHPHSLKNNFRMDVINTAVIDWLVSEENNDIALLVEKHLRFLR